MRASLHLCCCGFLQKGSQTKGISSTAREPWMNRFGFALNFLIRGFICTHEVFDLAGNRGIEYPFRQSKGPSPESVRLIRAISSVPQTESSSLSEKPTTGLLLSRIARMIGSACFSIVAFIIITTHSYAYCDFLLYGRQGLGLQPYIQYMSVTP